MGDNSILHQHAGDRLEDHRPRPASAEHQSPPLGAVNGGGGVEEEDYTIKCICGFSDDDGHTTLCEQCNTWQHVDCYYHHTNHQVPEVHKCVDCAPHQRLDFHGAAQRQRLMRDPSTNNDERKTKRPSGKGHRKSRTKDLSSIATNHVNHVNGWSRHDSPEGPRSRSPYDHAPPSKRAKTHHRDLGASPAIFVNTNGTDAHGADVPYTPRPPTRPPLSECPPNYFSPDFIRAHQDDPTFQSALPGEQNDRDIAVVSEMGTWLEDPEAFAAATKGKRHAEVLQRYGESWKDHQPPVRKFVRKEPSALFHGAVPTWISLVANRPIQKDELVGELIGEIGKRETYFPDPDNKWDRLRHPDHYVFFHPHLPIYIDCRSRGSTMRHVRRGCASNVKLSTFIEDDRHWHFAFCSTREIREDEEIVVDWTMHDSTLLESLKPLSVGQILDRAQEDYVTNWVSNVLAHFGGCACDHQYNAQCVVGKYDRRLADLEGYSRIDRHVGINNNNKHRAHLPVVRPDVGTNARDWAQPQSPNHDSHQEGEDAVSSSRSSPSATSRDQTPGANGFPVKTNGLGNEPSEREKKKMQQQARLIEKMDQEQQRAQSKKKQRRSGSNPNTPVASAPVRLPEFPPPKDSSMLTHQQKQPQSSRASVSQPGTPAALQSKASRAKSGSYFNGTTVESPSRPSSESPVKNGAGGNGRATPSDSPPRPRPVYVDASVQTLPPDAFRPCDKVVERKPYKPLSQRLLRRNHLLRAAEMRSQSTAEPVADVTVPLPSGEAMGTETYLAGSDTPMDVDSNPSEQPRPSQREEESATAARPDSMVEDTAEDASAVKQAPAASDLPPDPPPPPWGSRSPLETKKENTSPIPHSPISSNPSRPSSHNSHRPTNLRVDLPPAPQFNSPSPVSTSASEPKTAASPSNSVLGGNVIQSPSGSTNSPQFTAPTAPMSAMSAAAIPPLTPTTAVAATSSSITQPSPAKKKMSLADYSKRRASQAQTPGTENVRPIFDQAAGVTTSGGKGRNGGGVTSASASAAITAGSSSPTGASETAVTTPGAGTNTSVVASTRADEMELDMETKKEPDA